MTKTIALTPFGKNSSLVEFLPGLNMPSEDEFKALGEAAEILGIDLIKEPFPGESEELCPAVRQDIWRMWLRSNSKVRDSLILRSEKVINRNFILSAAAFIGGAALFVCAEYILIMLFRLDNILFLFMLLNIFPASLCGYIVDELTCKKVVSINALLDDDSRMWPHRMALCLKFAMDKKSSLSLELQALAEFINEVGPESNWGVVLLEDQIAMSKLSYSLKNHKHQFSKGFILSLSGENSELVSRACSAVKPGRLEALMERIERPGTLKI